MIDVQVFFQNTCIGWNTVKRNCDRKLDLTTFCTFLPSPFLRIKLWDSSDIELMVSNLAAGHNDSKYIAWEMCIIYNSGLTACHYSLYVCILYAYTTCAGHCPRSYIPNIWHTHSIHIE